MQRASVVPRRRPSRYHFSMDDTAPLTGRRAGAAPGDWVLIAGKGTLRTVVLTKPELVIGRDPACDVSIDDRSLSRRHAVLRLGPPLTIQDLESTNGVRLARQTMRGGDPVALELGETFHLGEFSVTVVAGQDGPLSTEGLGPDRLRVDDPTPEGVPRLVHDVARSGINVLIQGESGVGKDVLAATLHQLSGRLGDLARINCAALAEPLIESELFGHEKGAFTGAAAAKRGLLEDAAGGSVFLDEIGELPLTVQAKLLRAIESREILRIGATRLVTIDVRFIAATNRDLPTEVAARRFRHDLYFRLDGITLALPPLRERRGRISELALRFAGEAPLSADVLAALEAHRWPGNVRELKAVIDRARLLAAGRPISVRHLAFSRPPEARPPPPPPSPPVAPELAAFLGTLTPTQRAQRERLVELLDRHAGNQTRVARELGIARGTLITQLAALRIPRPRS
jgi:two-component system, NtrC family, response regulator AtoC